MISIQNIYYMLSYAFQVLNEQGYKSVETESFENVAELCAAILAKGITKQIKQGLGRAYIEETETLSTLRGRLEITQSIQSGSLFRKQMVCTHDEYSVNSYLNRILKTTMMLLLRSDISKTRQKPLKKLLIFFAEVEELDVHTIQWNVPYNRNNQTYRMLVAVCQLVIKGLLQTQSDGTTKLMDFLDEQRECRLYEKFILEYYRKRYPQLSASASQIPWALDDDSRDMLPTMQTDIVLKHGNQTLIIDAKYYTQTTQELFGVRTLRSNNLYQLFTYVKNLTSAQNDPNQTVSGMLLYAHTDETLQPDNVYQMSGNQISVKTLDLNCDFARIAAQLNKIVEEHFALTEKTG